ncbi:unnamed protein product, partial [marine sediment metagenome]
MKYYNIIFNILLIILVLIVIYCIFRPTKKKNKNLDTFENKIKIDLVYTWVDDTDIEWKNVKNEYSNKIENIPGRSKTKMRFKNNDEMRYSLRSIYKYAPWINNIYIVVYDGHIPDWINLNNPKINLVWHSKIFENTEHLPTFNSQAIECHIDNIPNLSEYFLYFNDDMMLGNKLEISDLIHDNGKPYFLIDKKARTPDFFKSKPKSGHNWAWYNINNLLKNRMGINNKDGVYTLHQGRLYKKSLIKKIKKIFRKEFNDTSKSKFRSKNDISPLGLISMVC